MKLIVGLGNPEPKYNKTRHNTGFFVLDSYSKLNNVELTKKDKFKAMVGEFRSSEDRIIVAMPTTYYNNSGEAVRSISDFYKIEPSDILIIHDELAIPFGTIRSRRGGSDAGNNGVKSVNEHMGKDTARLRIGIYDELREHMDDADFVLSSFSQRELETMPEVLQKCLQVVDSFVTDSFVATTA